MYTDIKIDIKQWTQQIQYVYNIYAILHSVYNKRSFFKFLEKWSKKYMY